MDTLLLILLIVTLVLFVSVLTKKSQEDGSEDFRWGRRRWGGYGRRWGGYHHGWGGWWPYYYTSWPPNLYGYHYNRCVESNEASDCSPTYPVKVGTDSNGDGTKDTWKCCRSY